MTTIIIFALFGAVLFYIFKSYSHYEEFSKEAFKNFSINKESIKNSELGLFVALVAKVAKADGKVDSLEAELVSIMFDDISNIFPEPQKTKEILKEIFNEEKNNLSNVEDIAHQLSLHVKRDKAKQQQFMGFLIQLAFVDGEVSPNEEEVIKTIAQSLEFDPEIYHKIFDQFEQMANQKPKTEENNLQKAYEILGVSQNDDMQTIKKAYRKLVKQYHPDIIKAQGKDENYIKEATLKTQEINQAYETIKKFRG